MLLTATAESNNLPASSTMPDEHHIFKVKVLDQLEEVVGPGIHAAIPFPRLTRATVATPIMSHNSVAPVSKEDHLVFPIVRAERPAVAEYDRGRRLIAPVLIVDLGTVSECEVRHLDGGCQCCQDMFAMKADG